MTWMSMGESIASNGDRHVQRGLAHYEAGKTDYAAGSFAKALKNYVRAFQCGAMFTPTEVVEAAAANHLQTIIRKFRA